MIVKRGDPPGEGNVKKEPAVGRQSELKISEARGKRPSATGTWPWRGILAIQSEKAAQNKDSHYESTCSHPMLSTIVRSRRTLEQKNINSRPNHKAGNKEKLQSRPAKHVQG